mmetsp:Transcript_2238/g.6823  ORF Transcript_2238/g.6823 Transcript_2238/m.6823 type:complete len:158 (+) Transcript_2238:320-793(+)
MSSSETACTCSGLIGVLAIACQLGNLDTDRCKEGCPVLSLFMTECLHWRKVQCLGRVILTCFLADHAQDGQLKEDSLASTSGRTDHNILGRMIKLSPASTLYSVEASEGEQVRVVWWQTLCHEHMSMIWIVACGKRRLSTSSTKTRSSFMVARASAT